jgi:hypothetical protein
MSDSLHRKFVMREIPAGEFGHREHIQVAYELLQKHSFMEAATLYSETIVYMATLAGAPDKFNLTITLAFLGLIAERMELHPDEGFDEFYLQNPDLNMPLLKHWYSADRLATPLSRKIFLMPDIQDKSNGASVG